MKKSKLINFTILDFVLQKELELKSYRWYNETDKYIPKFKANGLYKVVPTKIYNKEWISRLRHLFKYEDEKAYKKYQPIFSEIERKQKEDQLIKIFRNRVSVL